MKSVWSSPSMVGPPWCRSGVRVLPGLQARTIFLMVVFMNTLTYLAGIGKRNDGDQGLAHAPKGHTVNSRGFEPTEWEYQKTRTLEGSPIEVTKNQGSFMLCAYTRTWKTCWSTPSGSLGGYATPNHRLTPVAIQGALLQSTTFLMIRDRIRDRIYENDTSGSMVNVRK